MQDDELKDWPIAQSYEPPEELRALTPAAEPAEEPEQLYVIAKSDSIEHLYWGNVGPCEDNPMWGPIEDAMWYHRDEIANNPEPVDGFWMPLERAEELES